MNNSTGTKKGKCSDSVSSKERYASLIESLVQEEIKLRERTLLSDWRIELSAVQTGRG